MIIQTKTKTKTDIPYAKLSNFKEKPKEGCTYIVKRNLKALLDLNLKDIHEFTNSNFIKYKALQQLKYVIILAESNITEHIENLFKSLSKILYSDIEHNEKLVLEIAEIIGFNVSLQVSMPIILKTLNSQQFKQSTKLAINLLTILSKLIQHVSQQHLNQFRNDLFLLIQTYDNIFIENDEGLVAILKICTQVLNTVHEILDTNQINIIFSLLLNIQATRTIKQENRKQSLEAMKILSKRCGYQSIAQLHANQIGPVLQKIVDTKSYLKWIKTSKERFKFDVIVRNCHEAISKFMHLILEVIQFCIGHQNDLQVRIDTLVLIQHILTVKEVKSSLQAASVQIIKNILIPSIQWKVGKPQIKIRKAGVINIINIINQQIISSQQMLSCFKQLLPPLKNCLTDDWAPELRLASCELIQKFLLLTQNDISENDLRDLYPSLLERLDDSQDPIRKKTTLAINLFFNCPNLKKAPTIFEYTLNAVFIHFDDHNQEIQDAVLKTLTHGARFDVKKVYTQAEISLKKMKNTSKCLELIQYCKQIMEQQQS